MATNQVIIKIPFESITTISAEHTIAYYTGKKTGTLTLASDDAETGKTANSQLSISLSHLPNTAVINSLKIPLENIIANSSNALAGNEGSSFAVQVENTQYGVDANGNIIDNNIIAHLNNYKILYGVFPDIVFIASSWTYRPGKGTTTIRFKMSYPIITCTIEGGQSIYRPIKDIETGHEIPEGFSGVYQLLNEIEPDGDFTCVYSYGPIGVTDGQFEDKKSIIAMDMSFPRNTDLKQLRLLSQIYLGNNSKKSYGSSKVRFIISAKDEESAEDEECSFTQNLVGTTYAPYITDAWFEHTYFIFEGIIPYDSSLCTFINDYYKKHGIIPEIQISLNTYAEGNYDDSMSLNKSAEQYAKISQVYLEAVYEERPGMAIYRNVDGVWARAQTAYKKQNGSWIGISEDECKTTLKNSFIINN